MVKVSFVRLGSLVMNALIEKLSQPSYRVTFRKLMAEFQSNAPDQVYFRSGRAKVQDSFPNIGFEIQSRKDNWAATSYTKDIEFGFTIFIAVKALAPPQGTETGQVNQIEHYIIALSEFVHEVLNEPIDALQYLLTEDQAGNQLKLPVKIYDSMSRGIQYGYLYNGALRIGEIDWFGKVMRVGATGNPGGYPGAGQLGY